LDAAALQKIALTVIADQTNNFITARTHGRAPCCQFCRIAFFTDASGNGSVFGTDANRDEDISRNGSSWFDGNADSAEVADLVGVYGALGFSAGGDGGRRSPELPTANIMGRDTARGMKAPVAWFGARPGLGLGYSFKQSGA